MRFFYLRDPLFLTCLVLYFVNRWILKSIWSSGFVHNHLNDLICIPFWVPIMVWSQKRLGFRESDGPPLASEILIPLFVWSWFFEFILPAVAIFSTPFVSDYLDIIYYSAGALLASVFWSWWYRDRPPSEESFRNANAPPGSSDDGSGRGRSWTSRGRPAQKSRMTSKPRVSWLLRVPSLYGLVNCDQS